MSKSFVLRGSAAVAALIAASAAHAELSADRVWEAWQTYSEAAGQTLEAGSLTRDGKLLTATDVKVSSVAADAAASMAIPQIQFQEQSDGTVVVTMTDSYALSLGIEDAPGMSMDISHPGLRIVVSETATGLDHAMTAPEFALSLASVEGMGDDMPAIAATMVGVSGRYDIPNDPGGPVSSDFDIAAINLSVEVDEMFTSTALDYAVTGVTMRATGAGLNLMDPEGDPAEALRGGFAVDLNLGYDTQRYNMVVEEFGDRTEISGSALGGESRFAMSSDGLIVSTSSRSTEITMAGGEIPFPELTITAQQLAFGVAVPVTGGEAAQDFSLLFRLVDAAVPEDVWSMLDPMGQIARTPATAIIDLGGKLVLAADLLSEDTAMMAMMFGPMGLGELQALDIRDLQLKIGGAELSGSGGFTFDNTDLETFDGLPRPTGTLDLALRGGNALLDTLVGMGLVPEEQAMGARMMLALFARPGEGPDELLSTLEVREDGGVYANGMRLQ